MASSDFKELESFFVLKETKEKDNGTSTLTFECVKCLPKIQNINSDTRALFSNLRKHYKSLHKDYLSDLNDAIFERKKNRSPSEVVKNTSKNSEGSTSKSNPFEIAKQSGSNNLTQREFNDAIADLITSEYLAFTITRRPGWRRFLSKVQPKREQPCYKTISKTIDERFVSMISTVKNMISKAQYVAATTDEWSAVKKSFLGYTCTWLDDNFERIVAGIACRRFIGSKTYATLTPHMCQILEEFSIHDKCQGITTDSATNYEKVIQTNLMKF